MKFVITLASMFAIAWSANVSALSAGDKAPNFKIPRLELKGTKTLSSYKGKVVYLDFWASWCGPCKKSLPLLDELRKEYKKKGFEVLAINLDEDKEEALSFLKKFPVSYPTLYDKKGVLPEKYEIQGMPTSFLIDRKGKIAMVHTGFKTSDMKKIREAVVELLKKK